jgi:capsular exopolysaccharide synthesis family protein
MISRNTSDDSGNDQATSGAAPVSSSNALRVIWSRKPWVLLCLIGSVAVAWLYLSRQTPIYVSTSRLYVQEYTKLAGDNSALGNASGASTQAELIASTPLLKQVVALPELQSLKIIKGMINPIAFIQLSLAVVPDRDFINISFESPDAVEAAQIVNSIADTYISFTDKQHHNNAADVLKILQKEKDKREAELDTRRKATLEFKRSHGILSFQDEKGNIVLQRLSRLSELLTTAQLETMDAKSNLDMVEDLQNSPLQLLALARSDQPRAMELNLDRLENSHEQFDARLLASGDALRAGIEQAERQLDKLRRTRTPLHRDVQDAEADLATLKEQLVKNESEILERKQKLIEQEQQLATTRTKQASKDTQSRQKDIDRQVIESFVARARRRTESAKQRESQLQKNFDEQKKEAFELNATAAEYVSLESEFNRSERLVNMLEDRIKDINVGEDTGIVTVQTIDVARPSDVPIRPDRKRILGAGLMLGLFFGVGIAFGLDFLDQRIRTADEVTALLGVPILGLVPNIASHESPSMRGRKVLLEPTSDISEAYRTIRTAVYFAAREQRTKKLLVTSPAPGDGKTTSASNLAIAMAQAGRRVLLLDADFRRPTQHKIFEITPEIGLSSVMSGFAPLEKAIHRTEVENLHLLPCGPIPANPSEILNGQAFADLLESLERKYDHIVIDSPPIAPVTDARILGALCDETILVLRAHKSTRRLSQHARDSLASVGANILGVIVNDVSRGREGYSYYSGYGYGYRYYRYGYGNNDEKSKAKAQESVAS